MGLRRRSPRLVERLAGANRRTDRGVRPDPRESCADPGSAAIFSFYASARSLQIGDGVAVIAVTSVAANLSTIVAGLVVFGDRLGRNAFTPVIAKPFSED